MEEVGLRGATTSVEPLTRTWPSSWSPTSPGTCPGSKPEESSVKLGQGPTMVMYDARMIPNLRLRDLVMDTAEALGHPLQVSRLEGGATDGAAIHLHKSGVPTVVLGVAARHIHSHSSIIHREDFDGLVRLLVAARSEAGCRNRCWLDSVTVPRRLRGSV